MDGGETIHTENSHNYEPGAHACCSAARWSVLVHWADPQGHFLLFLAEAVPSAHLDP